jgi:hypothetical protein
MAATARTAGEDDDTKNATVAFVLPNSSTVVPNFSSVVPIRRLSSASCALTLTYFNAMRSLAALLRSTLPGSVAAAQTLAILLRTFSHTPFPHREYTYDELGTDPGLPALWRGPILRPRRPWTRGTSRTSSPSRRWPAHRFFTSSTSPLPPFPRQTRPHNCAHAPCLPHLSGSVSTPPHPSATSSAPLAPHHMSPNSLLRAQRAASRGARFPAT